MLIKFRTRAELRAKKARGERAGQVPYGRRLAGDGRTLEPDQAKAAAMAIIRELKASGMSLRAIGRELDSGGIPAKNGGARWAPSSVRGISRRATSDA